MGNQQQIGVIGMAVMGSNLALNIANKGYKVSIYNRTREKTDLLISRQSKNLFPFYTIKDFIESLIIPRKILLMVESGKATDIIISSIIPYLNKNDIIIDGGNSFYKDTIRRYQFLSKKGFNFIGMGISGGEKGALNGPSMMPGGKKEIYHQLSKIFCDIAAKYDKEPCITYIGPDGAGHYVKMIHNGIEYGDMQLIAEAYFLLKKLLKINNNEISEIFNQWNKNELNSYLIDITIDILNKKNEKDEYILDNIVDQASNKGTGIWASKESLNLGVPLSLITESVFARYLSSLKKERVIAAELLNGPKNNDIKINKLQFIEHLRRSLYLGKIISYTQGFSQLKIASLKNNWNLNYKKIAKIFRSGCIIRAKFLKKIINAYENNLALDNLLVTPYFTNVSNKYQISLRKIASYAINYGIPVPCLLSALSYYDSYRTKKLPANLIQAQRDYFGSHMYQLIDKKGLFHTDWVS